MSDKIFRSLLLVSALILLLIFAGMFFSLSKGAVPAFREFGFFGFIFSDKWISGTGQSTEQYGALAFIVYLNDPILALLICLPFSCLWLFCRRILGGKVAVFGGISICWPHSFDSVRPMGFLALRPLIQSWAY